MAANGDQIFATSTGSGTQSAPGVAVGITLDIDLVYTITGGTGRFADASGTLAVPVASTNVSLVEKFERWGPATPFTLRGRISY